MNFMTKLISHSDSLKQKIKICHTIHFNYRSHRTFQNQTLLDLFIFTKKKYKLHFTVQFKQLFFNNSKRAKNKDLFSKISRFDQSISHFDFPIKN